MMKTTAKQTDSPEQLNAINQIEADVFNIERVTARMTRNRAYLDRVEKQIRDYRSTQEDLNVQLATDARELARCRADLRWSAELGVRRLPKARVARAARVGRTTLYSWLIGVDTDAEND